METNQNVPNVNKKYKSYVPRTTVKPLNVITTLNAIRHAKCYNIGTLNVKQIQLTLTVITFKIHYTILLH